MTTAYAATTQTIKSPDLGTLTDAELLQRHCQGCSQAYPTLIARHRGLLGWTLHHLRIVPEERADILQEALLKVHRQAASFRGADCARSWLRTIVTNTALTYLRDRGRRREEVDHFDDGVFDRLQRIPDAHATDAGRTVQRILLHDAVNTLRPSLRDAIVLADVHGLSMQDIATEVGVPVGTVKSRLNRARRQLREHLLEAGMTPTVQHSRAAPQDPSMAAKIGLHERADSHYP